MNNMFQAFFKKLAGVSCERLARTLFICFVLYLGLSGSGIRVRISPSVLYLMVSTFTAATMWQSFSSDENAAGMQNLFMLPFDSRQLVFSYTAALGVYVLAAKTAVLLSVVLAVSGWNARQLAACLLCGVHAVLLPACLYSHKSCGKKYWISGSAWIAAALRFLFLSDSSPWFWLAVSGSTLAAGIVLYDTDAYAFCQERAASSRRHLQSGTDFPDGRHGLAGNPACRQLLVWRYLARYLSAHKNYLLNTVILWCVAVVLPFFLKQAGGVHAVPIGLAVLSFNTPAGILLSCDRALEQAVRFLPGQKKAFCVPYCLFLFVCSLSADIIFLCSWQAVSAGEGFPCGWHALDGGAGMLDAAWMAAAAVFFSLQGAAGSVLLEWFCPIRSWKIESDLWHHPRKYAVPAVMLLLAAAAGMAVWIVPLLLGLLAVEAAVLARHL
ncbi:MAG: hypothetical protein HFH32_02550 [Eubacterium sp.]|nr:hypothetical protein [Eubacterium sp.]